MTKIMTVTKTKILTKQKVALALGISSLGIAGYLAAAAVIDVDSKIEFSSQNYEIQLDIPDYLDESLRYPQKIFSGRDIRIIKKTTGKTAGVEFPKTVSLTKRDKLLKVSFSKQNIEIKKQKENYFVFKIPKDTETGYYTVDFKFQDQEFLAPIDIQQGAIPEEALSAEFLQSTMISLDSPIQSVKRLDCGGCYWELTSAINPTDKDYGYLLGARGGFVMTVDGWNTIFSGWKKSLNYDIDSITTELLGSSWTYGGDPEFVFTGEGKLTLSILLKNIGITAGLYQEKTPKSFPSLQSTIFNSSGVTQGGNWADYPKISIDRNLSSPYRDNIYVFADIKFGDGTRGEGLFTIDKNGNISVAKREGNTFVESTVIGKNGEIYEAREPFVLNVSLDGGKSFSAYGIATGNITNCSSARLSTTSNRAWSLNNGPELAEDKKSGRLYAVWSDHQGCVKDPNFEYSRGYGKDFNVYLNYSDDRGKTWGVPIKVNDDSSEGDQGFPSIRVDIDGAIYIAFLDHRDNQDKPIFDVYFTMSQDGGKTFSKNIRVNDVSVPNTNGGRDPGDYLDMISIGKSKTFVAHPCFNERTHPEIKYSSPSDACITAIIKPPLSSKVQKLDYNDDNAIDQQDANILLNIFLGIQTCPIGKICDVNRDGKKAAISDIQVLNNIIIEITPIPDF